MNIAYVFDDNFASCAAVSLISLLENNPDVGDINIYIFDDGITEESKQNIKSICSQHDAKIYFIDAKQISARLAQLGVQAWRGRYSAYIKLMVSSFVPQDLSRLIVLDADTIVVGDISELNTMDLHGHPCAMALEGIDGNYQLISGVGRSELYNAGVIVYDLPVWRSKKVEERFIDHLTHVRARYMLPEEDPISIVLKDDIERLSPKFNFIAQFYVYATKRYFRRFHWDVLGEHFYSLAELQVARKDPRIYHCIDLFTSRPWYKESIHPYTECYDRYLKMTPWKDKPKKSQKMTTVTKIEYLLRKYLPRPLSDYFYYVAARLYYGPGARKYYKS